MEYFKEMIASLKADVEKFASVLYQNHSVILVVPVTELKALYIIYIGDEKYVVIDDFLTEKALPEEGLIGIVFFKRASIDSVFEDYLDKVLKEVQK